MKHFKKSFNKIILLNFPFNSSNIVNAIETEYVFIKRDVDFASNSKNPLDKRLFIAAYFLATIQVLKQNQYNFSKIKEIVLQIATDYVIQKRKSQRFFKFFQNILVKLNLGSTIFSLLDRKLSILYHKDGFKASVITKKKSNNEFLFGFDILECGICKLYSKHNLGEFSSVLCEVDYITSELNGLSLKRSSTIANGAVKCDFRFNMKSK